MKTPSTKYVMFGVMKKDRKWYAANISLGLIGGTKLKSQLIEFMEEYWNADIIGDNILIPEKSFK